MTTKQEIIDLIETDTNDGGCWVDFFCHGGTYCFTNEAACNKVIQMLKDLKPRVKKLEWNRERFDYMSNDDIYTIQESLFMPGAYTINILSGYYKSPTQAQEACQKHYEQTILGALEDE
jgi:hypothetical protein